MSQLGNDCPTAELRWFGGFYKLSRQVGAFLSLYFAVQMVQQGVKKSRYSVKTLLRLCHGFVRVGSQSLAWVLLKKGLTLLLASTFPKNTRPLLFLSSQEQ